MDDHLTDVERILFQIQGSLSRRLFVLAGPSGVGKNTIIKRILTNHSHYAERVRTYTTRSRRPHEVSGIQYHFISAEEFHTLALAGKLMEADANTAGQDVYGLGDLYSMPADIFEGIPPEKHLVIAEVDIHGMRLLKSRYPDCVTIFITAPPISLLQRIRERPDDHMDADVLSHRMQTAREQIRAAKEFDYIVFNQEDELDTTVAAIETIIAAERNRVLPGVDLEATLPADAFDLSQA
jgi:guanylate kinase